MSKKAVLLGLAISVGSAVPSTAATISTLYNTGVNAARVPVADDTPDIHYSLVAPGAQIGAPLAVTASNGFPVPPWLLDNATSSWVGTLASSALGPTDVTRDYYYQTTFSMAGLNPATAVISGQIAQDNHLVDVLINGSSAGISETVAQFTAFTPFSFDAADISHLNGGTNTLTFIVRSETTNGTVDYTSLRVEFLTATANAIPEPAIASLLGLGAFGCLRRRRVK